MELSILRHFQIAGNSLKPKLLICFMQRTQLIAVPNGKNV
jgi:hypothetical protein